MEAPMENNREGNAIGLPTSGKMHGNWVTLPGKRPIKTPFYMGRDT
jgi:hypothetical protein